MKNKVLIKLVLFTGLFISQRIAFCQADTSINSNNLLSILEYNNNNIKWHPHGIVRMLDYGVLFCNIKTNVEPVFPWSISENVKSLLWKNLNDTTKDFATFVFLSEQFNSNCCEIINNYSLMKNQQYLWRKLEKEQSLLYWKKRLLIN